MIDHGRQTGKAIIAGIEVFRERKEMSDLAKKVAEMLDRHVSTIEGRPTRTKEEKSQEESSHRENAH